MNMGFGRRAPLKGIVVAVLLIAIVTSVKLFGEPVIGRTRFLLYTTAVLLAALIGGRAAGLFATLLGTLAVCFFFIPPTRSLFVTELSSVLQLALFIAEGCLVSFVVSSLDNSRFWLNEGAVKNSVLLTLARRSRDRVRAENERLCELVGLYSALMNEAEPGRILEPAVNLLVEHLGADFVEIYERSRPDASTFILRAGYSWPDGSIGHERLVAGPRTRAGLLLAGADLVVADDLRVEKRFDPDPILAEHHVYGGLTLPIVWNDRVVGFLGIHTGHRKRFSRVQVQFARSVAEIVGRGFARAARGVAAG